MDKVHRLRYRFYTLLSFFLLVRHAQYYSFQNVTTEYGYNQSVWGIALIPVTAAFGISFCQNRRIILSNNMSYIRLFMVFTIPIFLNFIYQFKWEYFVTYTIYEVERRPPFLILIPISITVILYDSVNKLKGNYDYSMICLGFLTLCITSNFILYYTALMVTTAYLISKLQHTKLFNYLPLLHISCLIIIMQLELERIGFLLELSLILGFLAFCEQVASSKFIPILRFSMLEFYISQALFFTVVSGFIKGTISFLIVVILCYGLLLVTGRLQIVSRK